MATPETTTRKRLTKSVVEAIPVPPPGSAPVRVYDAEIRNYWLQVSYAGSRVYYVYGRPGGRQVIYKIGRHGQITADQARVMARRALGQMASGIDPNAGKRDARRVEHERLAAPTVADLAARYEQEHLPGKTKDSATEDRALIRDYILPALGAGKKVAAVTRTDMVELHRAISKAGKPVRANRALSCASKMFALAIEWNWRGDNPAARVKKNPEDHRERYLEDAELARLSEVLAKHPERTTVALIKFLMLTGCRFGEAAAATWDQLDLSAGTWRKPSSHTKQRRQHIVPLSAPALLLLAELKGAAGDSRYVFPSSRTGKSLVTIKTAWANIRRDAGIEDVRMHDLRHSFASLLASSGASLQLIGSLLGHSQPQTTAKYSHLTDRARREAVERVGALITGDGQSAEIVQLRRG